MPALSYKGRFVEYVENGLLNRPGRVKRQTIRNFRKHPIKEGDTLYHFYAMRTKMCKRLGDSKSITPVLGVLITPAFIVIVRLKNIQDYIPAVESLSLLVTQLIEFDNSNKGLDDCISCVDEYWDAEEIITSPKRLDEFAYDDGFMNWREMTQWWTSGQGSNCFPFCGQLVKW